MKKLLMLIVMSMVGAVSGMAQCPGGGTVSYALGRQGVCTYPNAGSGGGVSYCAPAGASGTAYTCAPSPAVSAYAAGTTLAFVPDVNGSGGATTVNVNSLGVKSVKQSDGSTNPTSTTLVASAAYTLVYDGTVFRVVTPNAVTSRTWPYVWQGAVQAAGTGFSVNLPAATAPTLTNAVGTMPMAILQYPTAQSTYYAWWTLVLPPGYVANAAISYSIESTCDVATTCDSTHASKVYLGLACSGSVVNAPTVTDASSFNVTNSAAGAPTTTTGTITPNAGGLPTCTAGQRAWIRVKVDTNTNSLTGPFNMSLFSVSVTGSI